jgi:hypothetical protein
VDARLCRPRDDVAGSGWPSMWPWTGGLHGAALFRCSSCPALPRQQAVSDVSRQSSSASWAAPMSGVKRARERERERGAIAGGHMQQSARCKAQAVSIATRPASIRRLPVLYSYAPAAALQARRPRSLRIPCTSTGPVTRSLPLRATPRGYPGPSRASDHSRRETPS